jgi:hypothetical protein
MKIMYGSGPKPTTKENKTTGIIERAFSVSLVMTRMRIAL